MLFWPMIVIALVGFSLILVGVPTDSVLTAEGTDVRNVWLSVMGSGLIVAAAIRILARGGIRTLSYALLMAVGITGLATAVSLRDTVTAAVNHIRSELQPSVAMATAQGEAELRRAWDGHYRAEAQVNGVKMRLMIDTGATMVLLPYEVVRKVGIDPDGLDFSVPVRTANGETSVALTRLSSIKVGPIAVSDVEAAVALPGKLEHGLLGMSFIDKLTETSFRGDRLILKK